MTQNGTPTQPAPPSAPVTGQPFMVQVQRPNTERENLGQVIIGAFGLTGALVIGALVAGLGLAGIWILWRKLTRRFRDDRPPTLGQIPLGPREPTPPPSSPDR